MAVKRLIEALRSALTRWSLNDLPSGKTLGPLRTGSTREASNATNSRATAPAAMDF